MWEICSSSGAILGPTWDTVTGQPQIYCKHYIRNLKRHQVLEAAAGRGIQKALAAGQA